MAKAKFKNKKLQKLAKNKLHGSVSFSQMKDGRVIAKKQPRKKPKKVFYKIHKEKIRTKLSKNQGVKDYATGSLFLLNENKQKESKEKKEQQSELFGLSLNKNYNNFPKDNIFHQEKDIFIYNTDVIKFLKLLNNESIDLIITSPPYNVGHNYDNYDDSLPEKEYMRWIEDVAKEFFRVCKKGSRACINLPFAIKNRETKQVFFLATKIAEIFNTAGFLDFEMITWHKGKNIKHFQGNNTAWGSWKSPSNPSFRPLGEIILVFSKISRKHIGNNNNSDVSSDEFKEWTKNLWYVEDDKIYNNIIFTPNIKKLDHPAVFPAELIERLIKLYSYTDDLILDPFNGTGTTTLVAFKLNRRCIGIDISKKYCEMAKERILNCLEKKTQKIIFSNLVNQDDSMGTLNEFFPYKESFSPNLLNVLCDEFNIQKREAVLDPFIGTGSVFTNGAGIKEIYGYDTNPLAVDISLAKLSPIEEDPSEVIETIKKIFFNNTLAKPISLPKWKQFEKYAEKDKYCYIINFINELSKNFNPELSRFLRLVVISNLDKIFDYKRDGNGIKFRKSKISIDVLDKYLINILDGAFRAKIKNDLVLKHKKLNIYGKSSLDLQEIPSNSIDILLTSPPYANMFDYFEVYKMELWTGGYVKNPEELKLLRKGALRSNTNANINDQKINIDAINTAVERINNKKTKKMLHNYFFDMGKLISNVYSKLKEGGWMFIVVGNSFYEITPIPTDNLLSIIANNYGFNVEEIKKARTLKTSSQQMRKIEEINKKYLRESILCLRK